MKNVKLNKLLAYLVIVMAMVLLSHTASAQDESGPQNYCSPINQDYVSANYWVFGGSWGDPTWEYYICMPTYEFNYGSYPPYYIYVHYWDCFVKKLVVTDANSEEVKLDYDKATDYQGCYVETPAKAEVAPGDEYVITTFGSYQMYAEDEPEWNYYYSYCDWMTDETNTNYPFTYRIFIDWNMDGDFDDPGEWVNSTEMLNSGKTVSMNGTPNDWKFFWGCSDYREASYKIKIPDDQPIGVTRMRISISYGYYDSWNPAWSDMILQDGPGKGTGADACFNGYMYQYWADPTMFYGYNYGEVSDYLLKINLPFKSTFPSNKAPDDILLAGEKYNGTTRVISGEQTLFKKPYVEFTTAQPSGSIMNYRIIGPLPSDDVVYTALDPNTGSPDIPVGEDALGSNLVYQIQKSAGKISYNSDGTLYSVSGGEYQLIVGIQKPGSPKKESRMNFTISWENDLAAIGILNPLTDGWPRYFRYPRGLNIPLQAQIQNVGLRNVVKFDAYFKIYDSKDNLYYEAPVRHYDTANAGEFTIAAKQKLTLDFGTTKITKPDQYKIVVSVDLKNATDLESYNDKYARVDAPQYTFSVKDEIQAQAWAIDAPSSSEEIIAGRPFIPKVTLRNDGVGDISDAPLKMEIQELPNGKKYQETVMVQDIPSGRYNLKDISMTPIILNEAGNYKITFTIDHPDDLIPEDNVISTNFVVTSGLVGNYTIGTKNLGKSNNYKTIDDAMDALFYRGMNGSVTMEFTDPAYTVKSRGMMTPAWDLSSHILGLGYDSVNKHTWTLTFQPAKEISASRSAVTINLISNSGRGVLLGQNGNSSNSNAVIHTSFGFDFLKKFANNGGYITFNGGDNQSLRFVLKSSSLAHGSVFYLNPGSHNMTIKNIVMENGTPALQQSTTIPNVNFTLSDGFVFYPDTLLTEQGVLSYSAGIVNRARAVYRKDTVAKSEFSLDTIPNSNNTFVNNDISGFGFGIVSLGMGPLRYQGQYQRYYNKNTVIEGNKLYNLGRAGIYVGYEENSSIQRNNIFDVKGSFSSDAAGIIIGGNATNDFLGYNNLRLKVNANKISNIRGLNMVSGIIMEQDANYYPQGNGYTIMPNITDDVSITSNAIYDVKGLNSNTDRNGIFVYTQRDLELADKTQRLLTPEHKDYWLSGMEIINNTVILDEDGMTSNGNLAGIAVQNANEVMIKNNAVAINDNSISGANDVSALVFIEGQYPAESKIVSDRNAYYSGTGDIAAYRHVYTDNMSNIIEPGLRNEYKTLEQWQMETGNELNSVYGSNFLGDIQYVGTYPQDMQIKSNVKGSVLSRRGDKIEDVTTDVNGATRGVAGARYDVGAVEFNGSLYNTDAEILAITAPGSYRATDGTFNDAEYNMTEAPVAVKARIRNSGSLQLTNRKVSATIYRMNAFGSWVKEVGPITVTATVEAGESADIDFGLADGNGSDFVPKTYNDLSSEGYIVPSTFKGMEPNVTPLYKISIAMESDEVSVNNTIEKISRFYLKRAGLSMLISNDNYVNTDESNLPSLNADQLATGLNRDALRSALLSLGWKIDLTKNIYNYDLFNRAGWEPRNVNYTPYRTMIWSDGNEETLTRTQRIDFENFIAAGTTVEKKNLIIGSQEMVRSNANTINSSVLSNILRASNRFPYSPMGNGVSYDGKQIMGVIVGRNLTFDIKATGIANDPDPVPALMDIAPNGDGLPMMSFYYLSAQNPDLPEEARIGGVCTSTLKSNVEYLGIDWRHFGDINTAIRAAFDFVEGNGGVIVPIDLLTFNARQAGNRVDLNWQTASEQGSDRFDVERAELTSTGKTSFAKINEVKAVGNSNVVKNYGPITDANVSFGKSYVYRLRLIDRDGNFKLSEEKTVNMLGGDLNASMTEVSPNPSNSQSTMTYTLGNDGEIELAIYDETGKKVQTLVSGSQKAGRYDITINSRNLASGNYRVVMNAAGTILTSPLNVVK